MHKGDNYSMCKYSSTTTKISKTFEYFMYIFLLILVLKCHVSHVPGDMFPFMCHVSPVAGNNTSLKPSSS